MHIRALAVLLGMLLGVLAWSGPAFASCAGPVGPLKQRLADERFVFVGTVTQTRNNGAVATVAVESVWRGDVAPTVQVIGGSLQPNTVTSVDRDYQLGTRYLFAPYNKTPRGYGDNICTATTRWTPRIERLRPEGAAPVGAAAFQPSEDTTEDPASPPASPPQTASRPLAWIAGAAAIAIVAVVTTGLMRRRGGARDAEQR